MATIDSRDLALNSGRQMVTPGQIHNPALPAHPAASHARVLEVDVLDIIRSIWRRRWTVIMTTIAGGMIAFVIAMLWPVHYSSSTRVMLENRRNQVVDSNAVLSELEPTDEVVETEIEVILSRSVRELAAIRANLPLLLERRAAGQDEQVIDRLKRWWWELGVPRIQQWLPSPLANLLPEREPQTPKTLDDAVEYLYDHLTARQVGNTSVISIAVTDVNPNDAADLANIVANEYMANQIAWKRSATSGANSWLSARIGELEKELAAKRAELEQLRSNSGYVGTGVASLVDQGQTLINQRLLEARAERIRLQSEIDSLSRVIREQGPEKLASMLDSPIIGQLRLDVNAANQRLAELNQIYGPKHPLRLDAEAQLHRALEDITGEAEKELASKRTALATASAEESELQQALSEQTERGRELGSKRTTVAALDSEIQTMQNLLDNYLTRYKETLEQQSIIRADARVISAAVAPDFPDPPSRKLILLGGLVFFGLVGVVLAFAREAMDRTIRSMATAERILQVPVIGTLPKLGGKFRNHLPADYVLERPTSGYAESIRGIMAAVGVSKASDETKCILITSAIPGEGKSSTAAAMGRLMQRAGHSVALIECDLRRPKLAKAMKCLPNLGLMQLIEGRAAEYEVVQRDSASGMTFIGAGGHSENSLFLLQSPKLRQLVTWLGTSHDLIILDSPPVVPLSDAQALTGLADQIIFLCRWGSTRRTTSAAGVRMLVRQGGAPVYAALSQVDMRRSAGYDLAYSDAGYGQYYRN
ncbi:MAG: polysaccharide biosynthesis tyrosine autokinase [Geminicoccaceae bacterium]|nr:polysaccharide biosynthesis tyrosine autokinase [Geminicoccaceae bacterium]